MDSTLLTVLPNLSIGVVAVVTLGFMADRFLKHLDERSFRHESATKEREGYLREVEQEVRKNVMVQLNQNTQVMAETAKTLERVTHYLDDKHTHN